MGKCWVRGWKEGCCKASVGDGEVPGEGMQRGVLQGERGRKKVLEACMPLVRCVWGTHDSAHCVCGARTTARTVCGGHARRRA
eukprot:354974-Chlamydomonas_euryale.AAC.3